MIETENLKCIDKNRCSTDEENRLLNTYMGKLFGPEKAAKLLDKYFFDLSRKIDPLIKHLEDRNMMEIRKVAHQLKGSGKSYGFEYVTDAGIALSSCAKQEDYSGLKDLINNLDGYIRRQKKILSQYSVSP